MESDLIESISKVSEFIATHLDRPLYLHSVIDLVAAELGASCSFVLLHHDDTDKLSLAASTGLNVAEFRKLEARADADFTAPDPESSSAEQVLSTKAQTRCPPWPVNSQRMFRGMRSGRKFHPQGPGLG